MGSSVTLIGFNEFGNKVAALPANISNKGAAVVKDAGLHWSQLAKRSAPKDQGALIRGISSIHRGLTAEVVSPAVHSRFVEFGTKGKKIVPSDLVSYESSLSYQKTGDYYDFLNAILDWVKRKGLSAVTNSYTGKRVGGRAANENLVQLAQAIAYSIMKKGIRPQPFFFIHKPIIEQELTTRMGGYLKTGQ